MKLIVQNAQTSLREVTLRRPRTVVGRKKGCKVRIKAGGVSRIHCVLLRKDSVLYVKDLGSTNGTLVNGQQISMAELHAGDLLAVGPMQFMVQVDGLPAVEDAEIISPGEPGSVGDDAEVVFETVDDDEAADGSPAAVDADQFIVPTEGDANLDLATLADSLHAPPADDAANFLIDDDEPARERSTLNVAGEDDAPPHSKRPKPR